MSVDTSKVSKSNKGTPATAGKPSKAGAVATWADERLGLDAAAISAAVADPLSFVGTAPTQVAGFVDAVAKLVAADPEAASYAPAPIL